MDIGLQITGARTIDLRFDRFPEAARVNLREAITESTAELLDAVREAAPKLKGKLAASIQSRISETGQTITGIVGVTGDFGKAGALEYGSHKTITMKLSHVFSRIVPTLDVRRTLNIEPHDFLRGPEGQIAESAFDRMGQAVQAAATE